MLRKAYFDRHAKDAPLHIGELVYLRARGMPGRNKIQDAYRPDVFKIVGRRGDHDVYGIEPADGFGETRWVNRAELRPRPQFVDRDKPHKTAQSVQGKKLQKAHRPERDSLSSEDECTVIYVPRGRNNSNEETAMDGDENLDHASQQTDSDTNDDSSEDEPVVRRSSHQTAGRHGNPYHEPRSVLSRGLETQV